MNDKIANFLGLGMRAGKIISGEGTCKNSLKKKLYLIIIAEDASDNTKKFFVNKANFYNIPIRFLGRKEILGHCIGKSSRSVIAVQDKKFADILIEYIDERL